jgi:transcriptional regulator with XRE-family HTH domain
MQKIIVFKGDLLKMKQQLRRDIGKRLRALRKSLGFTQEQIVAYFDIGRANYSRIEKGEIFPGASILNTLKLKFAVSLDWLIAGEGEMFRVVEEKQEEEKLDFGEYDDEVRDLLVHMYKVPMMKHSVLSFFLEYKVRNREHIENVLNQANAGQLSAQQ